MSKQKNNKKTIILYILLFVMIAFIWGHSMMSADTSSDESGFVTRLLTPVLELLLGRGNVTEHLVRKMAHFCEYGALGVIIGLILDDRKNTNLFHFAHSFFAGAFVALIDESIQLFSDGRSASVTDVLLDSSGVLTGMIGIVIIVRIMQSCLRRHDAEN